MCEEKQELEVGYEHVRQCDCSETSLEGTVYGHDGDGKM